MTHQSLTIGVIGGAGKEGSGLAFRWAHAGHRVMIGSRDLQRSAQAVERLRGMLPDEAAKRLVAATNVDAARHGEVVVLAVPYKAQQETALNLRPELEGKVLVDVTVPLQPPRVDRVQLPAAGSAVQALQDELGPAVRVVSAFQNVSSTHLLKLESVADCDVLVCGDDPAACETVLQLVQDAGLEGWLAGPLANSAAAEAMTSVLITAVPRSAR